MKKAIILMLTLTLLLLGTSTALAQSGDGTYSEVPTIGTPATGGIGTGGGAMLATSRVSTESSGPTITSRSNYIQEYATRNLKCYAYTATAATATTISHSFEIQRWNGSSWVYYSSGSNSTSNTSIFSSYYYRTVSGGYYYRVKTTHRSYQGTSLYDSETLYSSYIYVD